jgi:hypothetical protein
MSVTPRQFATWLGVLLFAGGLLFLMLPVSASYQSGIVGTSTVSCGATLNPNDQYSSAPAEACDEAISARRMWAWPVAILGGIAVAGALVINAPTRQAEPEN